jgi:hypothetical protein
LTPAVEAELERKGYDVRVVTPDEINADAELQALVIEANRRFDEVLTNISSRMKKQIETRNYHTGDTLTLLAEKLDVDAVAFVRMQMVAAAKGVQALNMGFGGTGTMMSVSFVDRATTDIEAFVTLPVMRRGKVAGGYEDVMKDPDVEMAKLAEATLADLVPADPALRAERSGEDLLGDIEALIAE